MFGQTISTEEQLKIETAKRIASATTDAILSLTPQELSKLPVNIVKNLPQDFSAVATDLVGIEVSKISNENLRVVTGSALKTAVNSASISKFFSALPGAILAGFAAHFVIKLLGKTLFGQKKKEIKVKISADEFFTTSPLLKIPSMVELGIPKEYFKYIGLYFFPTYENKLYQPVPNGMVIEERIEGETLPSLPEKKGIMGLPKNLKELEEIGYVPGAPISWLPTRLEVMKKAGIVVEPGEKLQVTRLTIFQPEGRYQFFTAVKCLPSWDEYFFPVYNNLGLKTETKPIPITPVLKDLIDIMKGKTIREMLNELPNRSLYYQRIYGSVPKEIEKEEEEEGKWGIKRKITSHPLIENAILFRLKGSETGSYFFNGKTRGVALCFSPQEEKSMYVANANLLYTGDWTKQMVSGVKGESVEKKDPITGEVQRETPDPIQTIASLQNTIEIKNDLKEQEKKEKTKSVLTTAVPIVAGLFVLYHSLSS